MQDMMMREKDKLIIPVPCEPGLASFKVPHLGRVVVVDHAADGIFACCTDHAGCGVSRGVHGASAILDFVEKIVVLALG